MCPRPGIRSWVPRDRWGDTRWDTYALQLGGHWFRGNIRRGLPSLVEGKRVTADQYSSGERRVAKPAHVERFVTDVVKKQRGEEDAQPADYECPPAYATSRPCRIRARKTDAAENQESERENHSGSVIGDVFGPGLEDDDDPDC